MRWRTGVAVPPPSLTVAVIVAGWAAAGVPAAASLIELPDLEVDGFQVLGEVADGVAALEAVRRLRPQVASIDVHVPGMDGFAVTESLAVAEERPIVVLTWSRPAEAVRGRLQAAGSVRGFIGKAELSGECLSALMT